MIGIDLPEELLQLGLVLGVLRLDIPGDPGSVMVDASFFSDPAAALAGLMHDPVRREAALGLAAKLFGEVARTLDLPEIPEGQTWVPLAHESTAGLFAIIDAADDKVDLGFGGRVSSSVDGLEAAATMVLPLVRTTQGAGISLLPGSPDGSFHIGVALHLPPTAPGSGATLDGLALVAALPTAPDVAPSLVVRLEGLRLPAWPEPRDLVLSDDPDIIGRGLIELLHGLLEGRASLGDDASAKIRALLTLAGLGTSQRIPRLPLADLFERGPAALVDWLRALAEPGSPPALEAWLEALTDLLDLDLPGGIVVDPSGRRVELRVPLGPPFGAEIAVAVSVDEAGGAVIIRPAISSSLPTGAAASIPGRLRVEAELCAITLAAIPTVAWLPRLHVGFELARDGEPLVRVPPTGAPVDLQVGILRAGITAGNDHRAALTIEAVNVVVAGTPYPHLDLSSVEALEEAAATAASNALAQALDDFLGTGRGRALTILLGLGRPVPDTEPWPDLPSVSELGSDPVGAVAHYHARVLSASKPDGTPMWGEMATKLATLLRATAQSGPPAGTEAVPWALRLPGSTTDGDLELRLWRSGPDAAPSLHIAAALAAKPVAVGDARLTLDGLVELLRIELPTAAPAAPALRFAEYAQMVLRVGPGLRLDGGAVTVAATEVTGSIVWRRGHPLTGRVRATGATVTVDGKTIPLPEPFEFLSAPPAAGSAQWRALEALLGRWLAEPTGNPRRAMVACLLGWVPELRVRLAGDPGPGFDIGDLAAGGWPALRLEDLLTDPVAAFQAWLTNVLAAETGPDLAQLAAGLVTGLLTGTADGPVDLGVTGAGTPSHPWALQLGNHPAAPALLAWLDPDGPSLRGLDEVLADLAPADLEGGAGPALAPAERLAAVLRAAARFDIELDALLAGRQRLAETLVELRTALAGTDGLVAVTGQLAPGDTRSDTVLTVSHLAAPAAFDLSTHVPGSDPRRVVYVAAPLPGVAPWPGQPAAPDPRLLDVRSPGLPPEAFDLQGLPSEGPWWVLLPARPDAGGQEGVAARLRTVVRAVRAASAGPLTLVAHSVAGHAARAVWAGGDADALVTVATPYSPSIPAAAEAVRLMQRLAAALPGAATVSADIGRLLDLIGTQSVLLGDARAGLDGAAVQRRFPVEDIVPPALPPNPAGIDPPVAVVAGFTEADIDRAVTGAVVATGARVRAALSDVRRAATVPTHLGLGLGFGWPAPADLLSEPGGLRARVQVRLDVHHLRLRAAVHPGPMVSVRATLFRDGGWLVGSAADPGARLRQIELGLTTDLVSGAPSISVVLHDAALAGIDRGRIDLDATALDQTTRALLGELAASLSPVPAAGTGRAVLDILAALGVAGIGGTGTLTFDADSWERLIVDPGGALSARLAVAGARDELLASLRRLLGVRANEPLGCPLGPDFHLSYDADGTVRVDAGVRGVLLGDVLRAGGHVSLGPGDRVRSRLRIGGSSALPVGTTALVIDADTAATPPYTIALEVDGGRAQPVTIPLVPVSDTSALASRLMAVAAAEVFRVALEHARTQPIDLDPLLSALGLLLPDTPPRVRNVVWLLLDPPGWLLNPAVLGDPAKPGVPSPAKLAGLAGAIARLLGQPSGPDPGQLDLPGGGRLTVLPDGQGLVATAALRQSGPGGLGGEVGITVRVTPGPVVRTNVRAAARRTGAAGFRSAGVELEAGEAVSLIVRLTPAAEGARELVLPLLPQTPGLGALAELATTAAVEHALPALLEALSSAGGGDPRIEQFATALGQLGTALGLQDITGTFLIAELRRLAADPPAELAARFRARPAATLDAVRALVAAVTGAAATTGPVWTGPGGKLSVDLGAATNGALQLHLSAADLVPTDGVAVTGEVKVSDAGLAVARLSMGVLDADTLLPGAVDLLPFVTVTLGTEVAQRVEVGLWLDPQGGAERTAVVARTTLGPGPDAGTVILHRRVNGAVTIDDADLAAAVPALVRRLAVPIAAEVALAQQAVGDLLAAAIGGVTLGTVLEDAKILARDPWRLADGLLDDLVLRILLAITKLAQAAGGAHLGPIRLHLLTLSGTPVPPGSVRYGLGLSLPEPLEPPAVGGLVLAVEADDTWDLPGPPGEPLELWVIELPAAPFAAGAIVRAVPSIRVRGLGLRIRAEQGRLLDTLVRLDGLRLHGAFAYEANGFGFAGARLVLDRLGIDLGAAGGGNPVAGKVLAPPPGEAGDAEPVAPSFTPELRVLKVGNGPVGLSLRAGIGEGPWWIPVQRSFGPVYIAQIGFDVELAGGEPSEISLLLDGGAALGGLAVGVDDLELIVPWATAADPASWRVDLAGLGISYANGGVTLAGGLRKLARDGGVEYAGLLVLRAAGFGIDVIGSWGEFPVPGTGERYTSLFIFGALSATIGGPPAFFVTGLGAGAGINRGLIVPGELEAVPRFPLVAAMSPGSTLAKDPLGALDDIARAFPPARGAFWFAAGVRFTTFTVVESVALLAVAVGDGIEVVILGTSRMGLPNPATPLVMIELALKARFSSREGVLAIQAQLTENSWLINPSCRLTGGFAFVIWFRTGEVLLTLGGYHPRFQRPSHFPTVPRLGLMWRVSDLIVVKGESYFALTPTAVMAGMRIEAAFDGGFVAATFTAGVDAIVSWDPSYYDVTVYIGVSVRLQIEIDLWFLGTIRIWIGLTVGAELHVWGPRLRGEAILDLGVCRVAVPFGATEAPTGTEPLGWSAFHDKYLVAGDPAGETMELSVHAGQHVPGSGAPTDQPDDGSVERPFRLQPEFTLASGTRLAANRVNGHAFDGLPIDLVPMKVERVASEHTVRVLDFSTGGEVPASRRPAVVPVTGAVPDGLWRVPEPGDMGEDGVHDAFTGATIRAVPAAATDVKAGTVDDVQDGTPHGLPLSDERDPAGTLSQAMAAAASWAAQVEQEGSLAVAAAALSGVVFPRLAERALARCVGVRTARAAAAGLSPLALMTLPADLIAPPRLARITTGIVAPVAPAVTVEPAPPVLKKPLPEPGVPRLAALLWPRPANRQPLPGRTTVGTWGRRYARRRPPTMADALAGHPPLAARLHPVPPPLGEAAQTLRPRDPIGRFSRAGTAVERRRDLLGDREPLMALEAGLPGGVRLPAGQLQVWHVPRAGADRSPVRPALEITGDQTVRVVALGCTGVALADKEIGQGSVMIPIGTQRLVAIGTGVPAPGTAAAPRGLTGWHDGSQCLRVAGSACVVPGGLLRADAVPVLRNRKPVDAALITGGEAVQGAGLVRTDLPGGTRCVIVVVGLGGGATSPTQGLLLGLDGASQPVDSTGTARAPVTIVTGTRALLLYDVIPSGAAVTVSVGHDHKWVLAGVLGARRAAISVAAEIGRHGLDALTAGLAERSPRTSTLRWTGGTP